MSNNIRVGIEKIASHVPNYYVDLVKLAEKRGVDPNKWTIGIGQDKMAVTAENEDIVTMGANAANQILTKEDKEKIGQVIFATESGFDYSKAASTYVHELLGINKYAKSYEIKQACYSATAGLQIARDYVAFRPQEKVLVISSDIAKYGPETGGEVTQGAGAIAMLISADPKIMEITEKSKSLTVNSYDFWRPSYSEVPMVDGRFSTQIYIDMFIDLFEEFAKTYPEIIKNLESVLLHAPFSKMGRKALLGYKEKLEEEGKELELIEKWLENYPDSVVLCRDVGNLYTGSLYLSLISQILYGELKAGDEIALFSYGSGSVAEIFTGLMTDGFEKHLDKDLIEEMLESRKEMDLDSYDKDYFHKSYTEKVDKVFDANESNGFYLEKLEGDKRYYNYK